MAAESKHEYKPIPTTERQAEDNKPGSQTSAQYYQSVLDGARNKFINTSATRRPDGMDTDKMRTQLEAVSIDSKKLELLGENKGVGLIDANSQNIIENLSRPVSIYNIDNVADEMIEIMSKVTDLNIGCDSSSSIASFKVSGPSGSTA